MENIQPHPAIEDDILRIREEKDYSSEKQDVIYFSKIRWLSKGKTLKRFLDLLDLINLFLERKEKHLINHIYLNFCLKISTLF